MAPADNSRALVKISGFAKIILQSGSKDAETLSCDQCTWPARPDWHI
jgi:hypothetical protein